MCKKIVTVQPKQLSSLLYSELVELISAGSQVSSKYIEAGIPRARLITIMFDNDIIVATATLKKPLNTYVEKVFNKAFVFNQSEQYQHELGYIVTREGYEGKGFCQLLLNEMIPRISSTKVFATTRKSSMIHILEKLHFKGIGKIYDNDLNLLVYNDDF